MFTPILPGSSLSAWNYLKESLPQQVEVLSRDPQIAADAARFTSEIAEMTSVDDLMADYRALRVALGAHGLEEDLPNRHFVSQVIEQGTQSEDAFAVRLADPRYLSLAQTFEGLGLSGAEEPSSVEVDPALEAALTDARGDSPMLVAMAADLDGAMSLALQTADTNARTWQRAVRDPALGALLPDLLGMSDNLSTLDTTAQAALLSQASEVAYEGASLTTLIDPDNVFKAVDTLLGTEGAALEDGLSYQGLADRFTAIADANTADADRWAALQADTTLVSYLSQVLDLPSDFASRDASGQATALQEASDAHFSRDDFGAFLVQANVSALGDAILSPEGAPLIDAITVGGFTDAITAVRDEGASVDETWATVLALPSLVEGFTEAFGLGSGFADLPQSEQILTLRAETLTRFGTDSAEVYDDPATMAQLAMLNFDARISAITDDYYNEAFRTAVGEARPELRVALSLGEELQRAVDTGGTDTGQWYRVLGSNLLREAFETALSLPEGFGQIELEAQATLMRERARDVLGTDNLEDLLVPEAQENLIEQYLSRVPPAEQTASDPILSLFGGASAASILATVYSQG